jgi:hypothetical protein
MNVDDLIAAPQYTVSATEKAVLFPPLLADAYRRNAAASPAFARFLASRHFIPTAHTPVAEFPPLPVTAFKETVLRTCPEDQVVRELRSSSTTGQQPSRIFLDRTTAHRQARALLAILKAHIGVERRPYLVIDVPEANPAGEGALTARGAAIRGFSGFASETTYALRSDGGRPVVDWAALDDFMARTEVPVLLFGFTYVIWSVLIPALRAAGRTLSLPRATLFHGGGWKKLRAEAVSKESFTGTVAEALGCPPGQVLDYYGMVEQVGSIFVDCSAGHKHAPNFATVILRDPLTFAPVAVGQQGLIEVVSLLPASYPGQALLTDDLGTPMAAADACPCGRKDVPFRFTSRIERAELRGCGDVLAQEAAR